MQGHNLKAGQENGDKGRKQGARLGGKAVSAKPAPADCGHCKMMEYTNWMQHIGHLGFRAVMENNPTALHSLRKKIKGNGKANDKAGYPYK